MSKIVTISDKDNRFVLTVKPEFLEKCPEPSKHTMMELNRDYSCVTYLHNETGPAVHRNKDGREEFWLDGQCISSSNPELAERIKHQGKFNTKFDELIGE